MTTDQRTLESMEDEDDLVELKDVTTHIVDSEHKSAPESKDGYPYIKTSDIEDGRLNFEDVSYVNEDSYQEWTRRLTPEPGDIIFTREAPVGRVGIIPEDRKVCLGQRTVLIRPDPDKLDNQYLRYLLLSEDIQQKINALSTGSTVDHLNLEDLRSFEFRLPDLETQRKIGRLLRVYDKKTYINESIKDTLEKIPETVFNQWFVRFADYDKFKETDVGEVPVDFEVKTLEDVLSFQRGYSYSGDEIIDEESDKDSSEGYPMINLGNIDLGGGYRPENIKYCSETPHERYLTEPGDLIISHTDMTQDREILGSPVIVPDLDQYPMLFSHHLYAIRDTNLPKEYLYYYFLSPYFKPKAENFASGTTVLSFSSKITSDVYIPIPPQDKLDEYVNICRDIFKRIEEMRRENENLKELKETLLPKLMSGEVRVNNISLDDLEVDSEV